MNRKTAAWSIVMIASSVAARAEAAGEASNTGVFEAGVQHVCVPAAGGDGWDCGTEQAPPAKYHSAPADPATEMVPLSEPAAVMATDPLPDSEPVTESRPRTTPPPPPFLIDPMRNTPYAPVEEVTDQPQRVSAPLTVTEEIVPDLPLETTTAPVAATPVLPEAPVAPVAPVAPTPNDGTSLGDASSFARLPASAFTLQLAYAETAVDFPRLVAELGLDPASCFVLRVRGANGPTWLLAHGAFADANAAKTAQAQLPAVNGLLAQWPRRIGALQNEITQGR